MKLPEGSLLRPFLVQRLGEVNKAKGKIGEMPMARGFQGALAAHFKASGKPGVIAELKGGSPFDSSFRKIIPYKALAEDFEAVGAACLSVSVERRSFAGSFSVLATVHDAVQIPVLAQDIVADPYQMLEARLAGADAVILSAGLLGEPALLSGRRPLRLMRWFKSTPRPSLTWRLPRAPNSFASPIATSIILRSSPSPAKHCYR
jgi:indole-3-glycerol phosphate synthase